MKKLFLFFLWVALANVCADAAWAQVLVGENTIKILPYFSKKDTMEYERTHIAITINGTDTIVTENTSETFRVICTKANDEKGYRLEEIVLSAEIGETNSEKEELQKQISLIMASSFIGMKTVFSVDGLGQNLALDNEAKTCKEIERRLASAWDSVSQVNPALTAVISKEAISAIAKNLLSANIIENNFEEMAQMFELHGRAYEMNKLEQMELNPGELGSHVGLLKMIVTPCPEEGQEPKDWDDYRFEIDGVSYQDAALEAVHNVKLKTGKDVTVDQLKALLGDKMPTGEIEVHEEYFNDYFYDGWPKTLWYRKTTTQNGSTIIEVKKIDWLTRSTGNK